MFVRALIFVPISIDICQWKLTNISLRIRENVSGILKNSKQNGYIFED